jgi:hypothetical protein
LIEVFRKFIKTKNYGHLDQLWVAFLAMEGVGRIDEESNWMLEFRD